MENDLPPRSYENLREFITLPTSFNSVDKWPKCNWEILNQGHCGSCWAFGAAESLSNRFCTQFGVLVELSPQYLVSCDWGSYGCNGGFPGQAWRYMRDDGLPTLDCVPYTSGSSGSSGSCPSSCANGDEMKFYKAASEYSLSSIDDIKTDIANHGPVEAAFSVYQDFMTYKSGIYEHKSGKYLGGHAIKIVGWGEQDGTPYWIVANSWGTGWGMEGYFWIAMDQCGISDSVVAGLAQQ